MRQVLRLQAQSIPSSSPSPISFGGMTAFLGELAGLKVDLIPNINHIRKIFHLIAASDD